MTSPSSRVIPQDRPDAIIAAQVREIGEMRRLLDALAAKPTPADAPDLPPAP